MKDFLHYRPKVSNLNSLNENETNKIDSVLKFETAEVPICFAADEIQYRLLSCLVFFLAGVVRERHV